MTAVVTRPDPAMLREALSSSTGAREKELSASLGVGEAQLIAAHVGLDLDAGEGGMSATRIDATPATLIPHVQGFGEVMALTRTGDCVHEKIGTYSNFHPGKRAAMVLNEQIDLRIFPAHWVTGFAVTKATKQGLRHSIQIFDAAGDAVHKIHLRESSDLSAYKAAVQTLEMGDLAQAMTVAERAPVEAAKTAPDKIDILRKEWQRLTDTHQFLSLCSRLKMNRLGAYRSAGAPFVRALDPQAINQMLEALVEDGAEVMVFVGNKGCIQIHSGPLKTLRPMGPWQNVMDPDFNWHLRMDRIAEVWAVEKPTQRGPALSVEAFDAQGGLIFQVFGLGKEGRDSRPAWRRIVSDLPGLTQD